MIEQNESAVSAVPSNDWLGDSMKMEMTMEMTMEDYVLRRKSQLKASRLNHESLEPSDKERARLKVLDPLGEKFPFQCSCGVKHLFEYTESEGVRRLAVI